LNPYHKFIIVLALLLLVQGCAPSTDREYRKAKKEAQQQFFHAKVIVFCSLSVTNRTMLHQIEEIWRNNSNGAFTQTVGSTISAPLLPEEGPDHVYGQHSLLFSTEDGDLEQRVSCFFYNNRCSLFDDKTKEEIRDLLKK
jgi:hypothetical protein